MTKIERDQETTRLMTDPYCRHRLRLNEIPKARRQLGDYACERLQRYKLGGQEPAYKDYPMYCHRPEMRQKVREMMCRVGPRMVFYAPITTCRHLIQILRFSFQKHLQ